MDSFSVKSNSIVEDSPTATDNVTDTHAILWRSDAVYQGRVARLKNLLEGKKLTVRSFNLKDTVGTGELGSKL